MNKETILEVFELEDIIDNKKVKREFYYDFENMTIYQRMVCKNFFVIQDLQKLSLPENVAETKLASHRLIETKAYAALLLEKKDDEYLEFDAEKPAGISLLRKSKDIKLQEKLEACKADFLLRMGITLNESAFSLASLIKSFNRAGLSESEIKMILETTLKGELENIISSSEITSTVTEASTES